eukprot:5244365-Pleurochrysis_carterae.AAC.1
MSETDDVSRQALLVYEVGGDGNTGDATNGGAGKDEDGCDDGGAYIGKFGCSGEGGSARKGEDGGG